MARLLCGVVRNTTIETRDPVMAAGCAIFEAAQAVITFNSASFQSCYGPEYISEKLMKWREKHRVTIQYIQPGQPQQNAYMSVTTAPSGTNGWTNSSSKA